MATTSENVSPAEATAATPLARGLRAEIAVRDGSGTGTHGVAIVDVHGELSLASEDALADAFDRAARTNTSTVIVSLAGLRRLNAAAIALLTTVLIRANRRRTRLLAYGLSERDREVFAVGRLVEAIALFGTEQDAIAAAVG